MFLKQALLDALRDKPIDKVTVKEICERASVSRGTFYLHYSEPRDLLKEVEGDYIEENLVILAPYLTEEHDTNYLAGLFDSIFRNREACEILMGPHGDPQFTERMTQVVREGVLADWEAEFPDYDRRDLEFVYEFIVPGAMRTILKWARDDGGLASDQLAHRLDRLGHYCHLAIREFE